MTGQSRAKLASELMEYTDSTRYVAERLVRTETAHFLSEGQREAYEAAGIEKYRYLAALSERTCEVCASLDNKVFPLDEATEGVNYPTMHPNCRCVTITADAKLSTRLAKDPETGKNYKVDGNMDFAEWKESLTDEQKAVINKYVDNSDKRGIIKNKEYAIASSRYVNKNDLLYENSKKIKPIQGFEDIVTHGDLYSIVFKDADGKESNVSAKEFVEILKKDKNYKGGNIRLISCQVGAGEGIVPQYIANEFNVNVLAPTEKVFVFEDGKMFVTNNRKKALKGISTGEWRLFKPERK